MEIRTSIYTDKDLPELRKVGIDWDFYDAKTNSYLHKLHPYPAKFIPQIPHKAISEWSKKGDMILDPFCGSGTTLLEASLLMRPSLGVDNNGVACLVSKVKTTKYSKNDIKCFSELLESIKESKSKKKNPSTAPSYKNMDYWFEEDAIGDLSKIKSSILEFENKKVEDLGMAIMSSIIVRTSKQDSDTRYSRIDREYSKGDAFDWFLRKAKTITKDLLEYVDVKREKSKVKLGDSRKLKFIGDNSVDLIVTSPPYLNAYDYHKYHRHRLHWINADVPFARDLEIGKHDTFTRPKATPDRYFHDMKECFTEWSRVLKKGKKAFVVVGDAIVSKQPVPVADLLIEVGLESGLLIEQHYVREIRKDKKAFNPSNSRLGQEHLLLFKNK